MEYYRREGIQLWSIIGERGNTVMEYYRRGGIQL